jgi:rubrerythrin
MQAARDRLVEILRHAHAGERGAMHAYRGHWQSVRDPVERTEIRRIGSEEVDHRQRVRRILVALGDAPDARLETKFLRIGRAIGTFCKVGGWFAPMYGAGLLESRNVEEYEEAARLSAACGRPAEFIDDLRDMAEVERRHEAYFRGKAATHWLWRVFPHWRAPPAAGPRPASRRPRRRPRRPSFTSQETRPSRGRPLRRLNADGT